MNQSSFVLFIVPVRVFCVLWFTGFSPQTKLCGLRLGRMNCGGLSP